MNVDKLKIIDLFAGIGGIRLGFEKFGAECVFSSEWDKYAQDMYELNFGERPFGDINDIEPNDIPDHDFLLAGFPCQPFSIAGKQLGFTDTRGDFGIPQKRERIYIVGFKDPIHFKFPRPTGYHQPLSDFLENEKDIPKNYFVSEEIKKKRFSKVKRAKGRW